MEAGLPVEFGVMVGKSSMGTWGTRANIGAAPHGHVSLIPPPFDRVDQLSFVRQILPLPTEGHDFNADNQVHPMLEI